MRRALASFALVAVLLSALSARADNYQYVWDKTTAAEETKTDLPSLPCDGTTYSDYPFVLKYAGQHFFQLCTTASVAKDGNTHAVAEISGCNVRVSYLDKVFRMDIDSGSYNWLDPFGSAWTVVPYVEWLRNANIKTDAAEQHLAVHGGTTRWPSVYMKGWCQNDAFFTFDGGSHYIGGTVTMPYDADTASGLMPAMHFSVTNGAKVGVNTFSMGSGTSSYVQNRDFSFTVASGAELTISNSFSQVAPSGAVGSGVHRQHVLVEDATVRVGPSGWMNLGASGATAASNLQNDILFTNAVFVGEKGFKLNTGTATFVDCAVTNLENVQIGGFAGADARLELKNCDTYLTNTKDYDKIIVGYLGAGTLYVEGGKFFCNELDVGQNWSATIYIAATGTLELAANTSITIGNNSLYLGKRYGSLGRCTLGPTQTIAVTGATTLGRSGVGELTVAGGDFSVAKSLEMGSSTVADLAKAPGTNVLRVTSGTLTVAGSKSGGGVIAGTREESSKVRACRVELEGGVLTAPRLCGNANAQWSELIGNGGTVAANWSRTDWLYAFDVAKLGAKGLTLDSAGCDVTVAQDFANLPGETGRLILTGAGTKTLSGTNSREGELVVADGSVVLADGAAHHSALVVTNNASASLSASAAAVLKGLTLGDADSYGQLALEKDRTLVLDGDLVVNRARFTLGEGFGIGTVCTAFTVTGTVSSETIEKLNEAVIVSGLPADSSAEFSLEAGSPNVVKLSISDSSDIVIKATTSGVTDTQDRSYAASRSVIGQVSADADLTLSGKLEKGGLGKKGAGTMYVRNTGNRFLGSVILYEGRLSVSSLLALGYDETGTGLFHLKGGTLELADPENPAEFPYTLVTDPETTNNAPVVVKTDQPTVFKSMQFTCGAFFKRGKAALTFCPLEDVSWPGGVGNYCGLKNYWDYMKAPATGWPFDDAKGTLPGTDCCYGAFNVVEGDVVFTSPKGNFVSYDFCKDVRVGVPTTARSAGAPNPRLVIDNASVTLGKNSNRTIVTVGGLMTTNNSAFESVGLLVTNEAVLNAYLLVANCQGAIPTTFTFDHSTINLDRLCPVDATVNLRSSSLYTGNIDSSGNASIGAICATGSSTFNVDDSLIAQDEDGTPIRFNADYGTHRVNCSNGSRFCCYKVGWGWGSEAHTRAEYFAFDDAEWYPGATDFTFDGDTVGYGTEITVTGKGLVLSPPADCTYTVAKTISGTGGLVKRGSGGLEIPTSNFTAGGDVRLEGGRLSMTGGVVTNRILMTAGTLADTTATNILLTPEFVGAKLVATLNFENAEIPRRVIVECGDAVFLRGQTFTFGTYSGTEIDVSSWRMSGRDPNGRFLVFHAKDGVITAVARSRTGFIMRIP